MLDRLRQPSGALGTRPEPRKYARHYLPGFAVLTLFGVSMVSNLLMLAGPLFMLQIYDRVLASKSQPTLVVLVFLITGVYAFFAFVEALRARVSLRVANVVDKTIGPKLLAASIASKLRAVRETSDPLRDGETLRSFLAGSGPLALLDLPWVPVYLLVVFLVHPLLGWLSLAGAGVVTLLMIINEMGLRTRSRESSAAALVRQRFSDDARNSAEAALAMGIVPDLQRRWMERTQHFLALQGKVTDRATLFSALTKAFRLLLQSLVLATGAYLVINGSMTGGLMIAASVVTSRALAPIEQTVAQWRQFIAARQALGRIDAQLAGADDTTKRTALPFPRAQLTVRRLIVGLANGTSPILSGVSFDLSAGEGLGVLGPSGSGKSSLVRTLVGAWPQLGGEVCLDSAPLPQYGAARRDVIGYLPQRCDLFEGSVADNIARFRHDASDHDVISAAKLADVHELILSLPQGYDTNIGSGGDMLSAGQRQRIGLARALFGNPFLVVLDEPNANLDAEGDIALSNAIAACRIRGAVVVVVAHRPSALAAIDKVLFVRGGRQVAFGPKQEVLRQISGDNVRPMPAAVI